jgi:hypothetical protein
MQIESGFIINSHTSHMEVNDQCEARAALILRAHRLKYTLIKYDGRVWTEFIWLRMGTSDGLL